MPEEIGGLLGSATILGKEVIGLRTHVEAEIAGPRAVPGLSRFEIPLPGGLDRE